MFAGSHHLNTFSQKTSSEAQDLTKLISSPLNERKKETQDEDLSFSNPSCCFMFAFYEQ